MAAINLSNLKRYGARELKNYKANFDTIDWAKKATPAAVVGVTSKKKGKQKDGR